MAKEQSNWSAIKSTVLGRDYFWCFAIGIVLLYEKESLFGIGFVLGALILRLDFKISTRQETNQNIAEKLKQEGDQNKEESEPLLLSMTTPRLKAESGWDKVRLYPSRHQYEREYYAGWFSREKEIWEYDIKERSLVFQRLIDRFEEGLSGDEYEVVNGQVHDRDFLSNSPPYAEKMENVKREIVWHELHGAIKYFILFKHTLLGDRRVESWGQLKKLRESFSQIASEAEKLGAIRGSYGDYELLEDADDTLREKLKDLLSSRTLLKKYGIRSYREWNERDQILNIAQEIFEPTTTPPSTIYTE